MNEKIAVSVVFVLALFMNIMDITIVNVALPRIGRDLDVSPTAVSAVSIGYLVALMSLAAYHVGFLAAAGLALLAAGAALTINDEDAASTRVHPKAGKDPRRSNRPAVAGSGG